MRVSNFFEIQSLLRLKCVSIASARVRSLSTYKLLTASVTLHRYFPAPILHTYTSPVKHPYPRNKLGCYPFVGQFSIRPSLCFKNHARVARLPVARSTPDAMPCRQCHVDKIHFCRDDIIAAFNFTNSQPITI